MSVCDCYRCTSPVYGYDDHGRYIKNNLCTKPCDECGRETTEYVDLGTKGYHECWWCNRRAADTQEVPP